MARANSKPATTQLNDYEKEMAEQAEASFAQEKNALGSGQFFGLASGILTFNGVKIPDSKMAVIILDGIMENAHFAGAYNKDNPTTPDCFAFGRSEKGMEPHESIEEAYSEMCGTPGQPGCCPLNEWKSAIRQDGTQGKGKACKNMRRLAMIPAGAFIGGVFQPITELEHYEDAKAAYMRLPVTSVKAYAAHVADCKSGHTRPPHGVITLVSVFPDADVQVRVEFEVIGRVPNELLEVVMARHKKAKEDIFFAYPPPAVKPEPAAAAPVKATAAPVRRSKF